VVLRCRCSLRPQTQAPDRRPRRRAAPPTSRHRGDTIGPSWAGNCSIAAKSPRCCQLNRHRPSTSASSTARLYALSGPLPASPTTWLITTVLFAWLDCSVALQVDKPLRRRLLRWPHSVNDTVGFFDRIRERQRDWRALGPRPGDELPSPSLSHPSAYQPRSPPCLPLAPLIFFGAAPLSGSPIAPVVVITLGSSSSIAIAPLLAVITGAQRARAKPRMRPRPPHPRSACALAFWGFCAWSCACLAITSLLDELLRHGSSIPPGHRAAAAGSRTLGAPSLS